MELAIAFVLFTTAAVAGGRTVLTRQLDDYGPPPEPVQEAFELLCVILSEEPQGGAPLEGSWWTQALGWCGDWQGARERLAQARARRRHIDRRLPEWTVEQVEVPADDGEDQELREVLTAATISVGREPDIAPGSTLRKKIHRRWRHEHPHRDWELTFRRRGIIHAEALDPLPEQVEAPEGLSTDWHRVPLGEGHHGPVLWNLLRYPHALVSGDTGGGKSVALRTIVAHMARYGAHIVGADPKRVELGWIRGLDHGVTVVPDTDPAEQMAPLADAVEAVAGEMQARYELMEREGHSHISGLDDPPPPLVLVVDELGELAAHSDAADKDHRERLWVHLRSIASMGRAAEVHIIAATQHPYAKLLGGGLRSNLRARVACGWLKDSMSKVALDGSQATELLDEGDPPGRSVARLDGYDVCQVYWTDPLPVPPKGDGDGDIHRVLSITNNHETPTGSHERDKTNGAQPPDDDATRDGRALRKAREDAGLTQTRLADEIGWSQATVSQVERGLMTASEDYREAVMAVCDNGEKETA